MAELDLVLPGKRRTAHELVRDTLRQAIMTGRVAAGTRLVQADLAEQLQVSTTPVREALRDLAGEGLIVLDAHRGAVVREISAVDLNEIYELRQVLEPLAIQRAVMRLAEPELAEAWGILESAEDETDAAKWVELNRRFHQVFIDAAGSRRLAAFLNTLQDSATLYIVASIRKEGEPRRVRANREHRDLLQAVQDRDVGRAQAVMVGHVHQTVESVTELVPG